MSETPAPWERLTGEPNLWYDRFERFRLAGAARSVLATYNTEKGREGRKKRDRTPQAWNDAVDRWRWRERAEAWDESLRQQERARLEALRDAGWAKRENRLTGYRETAARLLQVIAERAMDPAVAKVPGGTTGLVVREPLVSAGELVAHVAKVDATVVQLLLAVGKQIAVELGEWSEKRELSGKGGGPVTVAGRVEHGHQVGFDHDEFARLFLGIGSALTGARDALAEGDRAGESLDSAAADPASGSVSDGAGA